MSSILCSQGVVLATAMAVSGTVILLALRLQKSLPASLLDQIPQSSHQVVLRSCISSEGKKKKKKRVHFAEDVVDPRTDSKEFRKQRGGIIPGKNSSAPSKLKKIGGGPGGGAAGGDGGAGSAKSRGMPANRVALYNGILRDRVINRLAYSC
ncbi:hypothetical protein JCGZ_13338 [Jatropha curcas]|uniref:Uncharacterized protein n=1 Tax=Jatropha curcas TaxID=180498 RepID=A0A067KBM1_JATCU|nr:uncharacterized protein LOC105639371 [Jatropha curcas]KDP32413.1 hypothetical protein JCGZ_13338 [Jatropha curcas]